MSVDELAGGVDVDRIWRALGPWGRYQWKQLLIYMFICMSWVIHQLSIVFIGFRPDYTCLRPDGNKTLASPNTSYTWQEYEECSISTFENVSGEIILTKSGCDNGWQYSLPVENSFVTEWDLVCDRAELAELSQSLMTVGMMVGTILFPSISDRFGRKPVTTITNILLFLVTLITTFSTDFYMFTGMRFLTGALTTGAMSGAILSLETFPKEFRTYTEVFGLSMWTVGICVMSPLAYALRNVSWRYIQLTYSLLNVWCLLQWWIYDESLRWLFANNRTADAKAIIKKACRWNKVAYIRILEVAGLAEEGSGLVACIELRDSNPAVGEQLLAAEKVHETNSIPLKAERYTVIDIFRHAFLIRVSLIIWYIWFADSLIYYGLFMISSDLYGDRYLNFFLSALCEFPAALYEFFALNTIGRKLTIISCHMLAAVGLIAATILTYTADGDSGMMTAALVFTLLGKLGITGAFSSAYVTTPELYPTNLRNAALGVGSLIGKVGIMVAPFLRNVSSVALWLPGAIFSVLCVIVVVLVPFLPETNDVELPDTIEELSKLESYHTAKYSLKIKVMKWKPLKNKPTL